MVPFWRAVTKSAFAHFLILPGADLDGGSGSQLCSGNPQVMGSGSSVSDVFLWSLQMMSVNFILVALCCPRGPAPGQRHRFHFKPKVSMIVHRIQPVLTSVLVLPPGC